MQGKNSLDWRDSIFINLLKVAFSFEYIYLQKAFIFRKCTYNEHNATNDNKQESQVENDVKYIFQSKSFTGGPLVHHCVTANARQQSSHKPE